MAAPARIIEILSHLHLGQSVRFLDWQQAGAQMSMRTGLIVPMRDTQLIMQDERTLARMEVAVVCGHRKPGRKPDPRSIGAGAATPDRSDLHVDDRVSFEDRHPQNRIGTIVRVTPRTATLDSDGQGWRLLRAAAASRRSLSRTPLRGSLTGTMVSVSHIR
ncbi:hypothetical protein LLG90_01210 [Aromatoleum toluclasticum]|nr:hypothetical protein [Aromatoleum toluclasticum]